MRRIVVIFLLLLTMFPTLAQGESARASKLTPSDRYEMGLRYMKRGYYTKALEQFNRIRNYHRDDPVAIRAELAIADLYYKRAEWDQARVAYEDFQRLHPRFAEADYVVYRVGLCLWKKAPSVAARDQSWTRQAVNTWSTFDTRYPDSELKPKVDERLVAGRNRLAHKEFIIAKFYVRREAWRSVIGRLEGLLASYPNAADRGAAMEILGEAYARQGDPAKARAVLESLRDSQDLGKEYHRLLRTLERLGVGATPALSDGAPALPGAGSQ